MWGNGGTSIVGINCLWTGYRDCMVRALCTASGTGDNDVTLFKFKTRKLSNTNMT